MATLVAQLAQMTQQLAAMQQEMRELRQQNAALQQQLQAARGVVQHQPYSAFPLLPPLPMPQFASTPPRTTGTTLTRKSGEVTPPPAAGSRDLRDNAQQDVLMSSPAAEADAKRVRRDLEAELTAGTTSTSSGALATCLGAPLPHDA